MDLSTKALAKRGTPWCHRERLEERATMGHALSSGLVGAVAQIRWPLREVCWGQGLRVDQDPLAVERLGIRHLRGEA